VALEGHHFTKTQSFQKQTHLQLRGGGKKKPRHPKTGVKEDDKGNGSQEKKQKTEPFVHEATRVVVGTGLQKANERGPDLHDVGSSSQNRPP